MTLRRASPSADRSRPWALVVLGYVVFLPVLAGFLLHTSPGGTGWRLFGKYGPAYAGFLAALTASGIAWPWCARLMVRPSRRLGAPDRPLAGGRKAAFLAVGLVLSVATAGVVVEAVAQAVAAVTPSAEPPRPDRPSDWEVFFTRWPQRGVQADEWGFRAPGLAVAKPRGAFRVVALGGSTTWLEHAVKPDESFVALLGRGLQRRRPAVRVETVNAACGGHTSFHSLIKYAVLVRDFKPDLVLVMHAINDIGPGVPETDLRIWRRPFERDYGQRAEALSVLAESSGAGRPTESLARTSVVLTRIGAVLGRTFCSDLRPPPADADRRAAAERATTRTLPAFRRNLRSLARLVRADGGEIVIASQPTMYSAGDPDRIEYENGAPWLPWCTAWWAWRDRPDIYADAWTRAMRRYNDANRDLAADLGTPFVDLERAVEPRWENFFRPEDGVHMSENGCAAAAARLERALLPLVPSVAPGSPSAGGPPP